MLYIALARGVLFHTKSLAKSFKEPVDILGIIDQNDTTVVAPEYDAERTQ